MAKKYTDIELSRSAAELAMLYEISIAMRATLKLDEILYIILTSVTAKEGLGFNRAMLFLVDSTRNYLQGKMSVGPDTGEQAPQIWSRLSEEKTTLDNLLSAYKEFEMRTDSKLNNTVKFIKLPLEPSSGILAKTILEGIPFNIDTKEKKEKISPQDIVFKKLKTDFFATIPLKANDHVVGVILVDNLFTRKPITEYDIKIFSMFADQAGLAIENSQVYEETVHLSNTDRLTGTWNHGYFQHQLTEEIKRSVRFNRFISLLMIDIDYFKKYNDTYGHIAGDKILKSIATILKNTSREIDFIARYGGEEFAIILPETTKESAFMLGERLRKSVLEASWDNHQKITISCGVASFPDDAEEKEQLINSADSALYAAKRAGRNRTCMYSKEYGSLRHNP
ncbi:MAG: sensor domain-containing diguanylate cyclase [Candidatus Omnitrophota bacterium]